MLKFDRIVVLSAAFCASIFCAGGSMLFAVEGVNEKVVVLSSADKYIGFIELNGLMETPFDGDFDKVKSFCAFFVSGLYKDLSSERWWVDREWNLRQGSRSRASYTASPSDLCQFIDEDTKVLVDFLVDRVFPSTNTDKCLKMLMARDSIPLKGVIARAFTKGEISLKGLSALLSSEFFQKAINSKKRVAICVKTIIKEGDFFCGKFADVFWSFFVKENDYHFRDAFVLLKFFRNHVPSHLLEMDYGLKAFESVKKRKKFQTFSEKELQEFLSRIACTIKKRNIMLHTVLMTVPPENVGEVRKFFSHMTEIMQHVRNDADSLLNERFSDSQYWKVEPYFTDEETKKIFDELNESE